MEALVIRHILAFAFSFSGAFYLVPKMIRLAHRLEFFDVPDGRIKLHSGSVPYLGGVAVFAAFIASLGLFYPFENHVLWFLIGVTLLFFLGLIDDLAVLRPGQKFAAQILAVLCFLKGGFSLRTLFFSTYSNIALSGFWMLSVINAINLVDVMDGLSSTLALSSASAFFIVALLLKNYTLSLLMISFIGPLLAFLWYNRPPARIYLGDAGSMFVGGFLAATPLLFSWSALHLQGFLAPLLIVGIPLLEITTLIIIRTAKGIPFYQGSPHHFSMYLQKKSWSISMILLFSAGSTAVLSGLAIAFLKNVISLPVLTAACGLFLIMWTVLVFTAWGNRAKLAVQPATKSSCKGLYTDRGPARRRRLSK